MIHPKTASRRRAALALEAAFVYPVMFLLLLCLIVGGVGVLRYQQVACQAQEAARWASVRGSDWARDTKNTSPTQQDILNQAVAPLAAGMDLQSLSVQVQWVDQVTGKATSWDSSGKAPTGTTASGATVSNSVRVTVTYLWAPSLFLARLINLTCTAEVPMSF
jgi:Flp pilus assembly protein TadG